MQLIVVVAWVPGMGGGGEQGNRKDCIALRWAHRVPGKLRGGGRTTNNIIIRSMMILLVRFPTPRARGSRRWVDLALTAGRGGRRRRGVAAF